MTDVLKIAPRSEPAEVADDLRHLADLVQRGDVIAVVAVGLYGDHGDPDAEAATHGIRWCQGWVHSLTLASLLDYMRGRLLQFTEFNDFEDW